MRLPQEARSAGRTTAPGLGCPAAVARYDRTDWRFLMKRWLRATRMAALGFLLPAMLASCGSSGGGGSIRLFFGTNGDGSCEEVVVEVDLAAAGAVLSRRDDQSADCALAALLDTAGCEISVEEPDDGETLRVTIDDCTIPAVSALFECGFSEADLSEFGDVAVA